jgi:hypothetical protein
MSMKAGGKQFCQLCALDDDVSWTPIGPGIFEYTCSAEKRHKSGQPHRWLSSGDGVVMGALAESEGPAAELGMLDDLPQCVIEGEGWVEYGVVEHRYAKLNPEAFEELRARYGHRILGPTVSPHHTASTYIARVLGMLRDRGVLAFDYAKATGQWSYNGSISYWAKLPPPPLTKRTTYEEFAAADG